MTTTLKSTNWAEPVSWFPRICHPDPPAGNNGLESLVIPSEQERQWVFALASDYVWAINKKSESISPHTLCGWQIKWPALKTIRATLQSNTSCKGHVEVPRYNRGSHFYKICYPQLHLPELAWEQEESKQERPIPKNSQGIRPLAISLASATCRLFLWNNKNERHQWKDKTWQRRKFFYQHRSFAECSPALIAPPLVNKTMETVVFLPDFDSNIWQRSSKTFTNSGKERATNRWQDDQPISHARAKILH